MAVMLLSCHDEATLIGSNFFEGGSIAMVTVDTLTLQTSTVKFDSLITNDASRLMVGYHADEDLGAVSCGNYFQLGIGSAFELDKQFTEYSHSELRLIPDGYSYYDTLSEISFTVHKITEAMSTSSGFLYNTTKFKYDKEPMGAITYKPKPNKKDTVVIALTDAVGRDLVALTQANATTIQSTTDFLSYFYGLTLVPSTHSGPIVGYGLSAEMRVYFIDRSVTPNLTRYLSYPLISTAHFNTISSDRAGTALDGLNLQTEHYNSDVTNSKVYLQSGTALGIRVEIPYLRNMLLQNAGLTIVNAVLEIYPTKDNRGANVPLPSELIMSSVNYKNELIFSFSQKGLLNTDYYLDRDTHYEADISTFINGQIALEQTNHNALLFTANDATFRGTLNRIYAGDQHNERKMILKISCLSYQK
jgi:hypothetical protein